MKLHVDLETFQLIEGPGFRSPVTALRFKRGDAARLEVVFLRNGTTAEAIGDPSQLEMRFGVKPRGRYDVDHLVHTSNWVMPSLGDASPVYRCSPSFNTIQLNSALNVGSATASELPEITLMGEITWREANGEPTSTRTFAVIVENDVNRGDEGVPTEAEPAYPAAAQLVTFQNLATRAVLFHTSQALTENQKNRALLNIGAASTALLAAKLDILDNVSPEELPTVHAQRFLLLEKNGKVWLHKPGTGGLLLTQPDDNSIVLEANITAGYYGAFTSSTIAVPAGSYRVEIRAYDFVSPVWNAHGIVLRSIGEFGYPSFTNPESGSFYSLSPGTGNGSAEIFLDNPLDSPSPQYGQIDMNLNSPDYMYLDGYLPDEGNTVRFTITFIPR